jgi:acyl carrier protein
MKYPSFEELAELVRTAARLKQGQRIDPGTQLLRDLKVNTKTGVELLIAIERRYGIRFPPEIHDHIEEIASIQCKDADEPPVIQSLLGSSRPEGHPWTVGRLYRAVLEELSRVPQSQVTPRE